MKKSCKIFRFFFSILFIYLFLVGNHLKHVEMQKQKFKYFFKMAAIAAILDFGPSPKSNGMILGPDLTPPTKFHPNPSANFLRCRAIYRVSPISQWWWIIKKIISSRSGFGSSPKLNQFFLVIHPTCPQNSIRIRPQLFEISCQISV